MTCLSSESMSGSDPEVDVNMATCHVFLSRTHATANTFLSERSKPTLWSLTFVFFDASETKHAKTLFTYLKARQWFVGIWEEAVCLNYCMLTAAVLFEDNISLSNFPIVLAIPKSIFFKWLSSLFDANTPVVLVKTFTRTFCVVVSSLEEGIRTWFASGNKR